MLQRAYTEGMMLNDLMPLLMKNKQKVGKDMKKNFERGQKSFFFSPSKEESLRIFQFNFKIDTASNQHLFYLETTKQLLHVKLTETKLQAEYAAPIMAAELPKIFRCVLVDTK